jgi:hypothetical protein
MDVLTDVNLLQTPLEIGFNGQKSDDPRRVHSGFFASARAISRRIKELLVSATEARPASGRCSSPVTRSEERSLS